MTPQALDCAGKSVDDIVDWVLMVRMDTLREQRTRMLLEDMDPDDIDQIEAAQQDAMPSREDIRERVLAVIEAASRVLNDSPRCAR